MSRLKPSEAILTDDQQTAAALFETWLSKEDPGVPFVLSGFAGSGKTFLSMRLLRQVEATGLSASPTGGSWAGSPTNTSRVLKG